MGEGLKPGRSGCSGRLSEGLAAEPGRVEWADEAEGEQSMRLPRLVLDAQKHFFFFQQRSDVINQLSGNTIG